MKTMKKTICAFLVIALLLGLCAVPVSATRSSDAKAYLRDQIIRNGKETSPGWYTLSGETVTDTGKNGSNSVIGATISCSTETGMIQIDGAAYQQTTTIVIHNTLTDDYIACYATSGEAGEGFDIQCRLVYKDLRLEFSEYRGTAEEKAEAEYWITLAFHRAMALLDSLLCAGGYTLSDIGFINYGKNRPVCPEYGMYCPGNLFEDMPNSDHWAHQAIDWAILNCITFGTSDHLFSPNKACTRAQVVTFLWRAAGAPEPEKTDSLFEDINPSASYYKPVLWAVENGLTKGISETIFKPDGECTRAQVVTFLWRLNGSGKDSAKSEFSDVPQDAYYADAVNWAVANGITEGTGGGKFSPNRSCTRAHVVTFLYRA